MNSYDPDDQNYCQIFQIKITESIVAKIINNIKLYKENAQTIQLNDHVFSIDKICLLANNVLRTAVMEYDFSNYFKLIPNSEIKPFCGFWGSEYDEGRGTYCSTFGINNKVADLVSYLTYLPLINTSKIPYNSKALEYMRTAVTVGLSAIPYAGLVLAATTNAILGPTTDREVLEEYKDTEFDEKLIILNVIRKQVLNEGFKLAKGYIEEYFDGIIKSTKNAL